MDCADRVIFGSFRWVLKLPIKMAEDIGRRGKGERKGLRPKLRSGRRWNQRGVSGACRAVRWTENSSDGTWGEGSSVGPFVCGMSLRSINSMSPNLCHVL